VKNGFLRDFYEFFLKRTAKGIKEQYRKRAKAFPSHWQKHFYR
jgi:hypothetical protein